MLRKQNVKKERLFSSTLQRNRFQFLKNRKKQRPVWHQMYSLLF